jgi:CBS domain-containing protein
MKVKEVMTKKPETVHPQSGLQAAAQLMRKVDIGSLPVVKDGRLQGILTDRDIAVRAVAENRDMATTLVDDVMSRDVVVVEEDQDVAEAARLMQANQIRRLPVVSHEGRLTGILSMADLAVDVGDREATGDTLQAVSEPAKPRR